MISGSYEEDDGGGGWVIAMASCWGCELPFAFNPRCVPSYQNQPICEGCMERVNTLREAAGLPPHPIHPDAYREMPASRL